MKLPRLLSLMGVTVLLSTVSVNPSFSQSLKDKLNQKSEKEKMCDKVDKYHQFVKVSKYKEYRNDKHKPFERFYVDSSNNVHSVGYGHLWGSFRPGVPQNISGRTTELQRVHCGTFLGKVGKQEVDRGDCKWSSSGGTYSHRHIIEWSIEGNELKRYSQTIKTVNCHTNNPMVFEGKVKVDGGRMRVR